MHISFQSKLWWSTSCLLALLLFSPPAEAQKKVEFSGAGRMWIDNDRISGTAIEGDTTTPQRTLGGYALFDLGFDIHPTENTEIKAVTRFRNELDGFWGAGVTTDIRQLYARGLIRKAIRYQVGDINAAFTPYTMHNFDADLTVLEPGVFQLYRDIINYENFYQDSTWRQQGAMVDFGLELSKGLEEITFKGMIAKNRQTDFFFTPDRLIGVAQVGLDQGEYGNVLLTYTNLFEIEETSMFAEGTSKTEVMTARYNFELEKDNYDLSLSGETGMSMVSYKDLAESPEDTDDSFLEVGLNANFKTMGLTARLAFKDVGPDFRSPAAQTRRLVTGASPASHTRLGNDEHFRPLALTDVMRDPTIYNRTFAPELMDYLPAYENVLPYGAATPNRRGIMLDVRWAGDSAGVVEAFGDLAVLSEIRGQGTEELRSFLRFRTGVGARLDRLYGGERVRNLTAGVSYQSTSRDGTEGIDAVDLTSLMLEVGLEIEMIEDLDFIGGMKMVSAEGNEFLNRRDGFNTTIFYDKYEADLNELVYAAGIRYRFSPTMQLSIHGMFSNLEYAQDPANSFDWNQVVVIYNLFF